MQVDELDRTLGTIERLVNRLALAIITGAGYIALGMAYLAVRPSVGSWQGIVLILLAIPLLVFTMTVVMGIRRSER